jgi:hypothetical protein
MQDSKSLLIFDFDGTVFKSIVPNPKLWGTALYGKIKNTPEEKGLGWYQDLLSLSDPYVPENPNESWFNTDLTNTIFQEMKNPNSILVLLTGRKEIYSDRIKHLLKSQGLEFAHWGFKSGDKTTIDFKFDFILNLINEYGITNLQKISMWDDRSPHVEKLNQKFEYLREKIEIQINQVVAVETFLTNELEIDLVSKLRDKYQPDIKWVLKPDYTGIVLNNESVLLLKEKFPVIDSWNAYYHHSTVCMGKLKETELDYLGKNITLTVVEHGSSELASAVKVTGGKSSNKIPHITLCVNTSGGGKPVDSNKITKWVPTEPFEIIGTVQEVGKYDIVVDKTKPKTVSLEPKGAFISKHTEKKGNEIGPTIKKLDEWLKEMNLTYSVENKDTIITYVKTL